MTPAHDAPLPDTGLRRPALVCLVAAVALLAGFSLWAQLTPIESAVAAGGQVIVRGKPKLVQSLDGGVVQRILVQDGDRVEAGQLVMRLDPSLQQVNLDIARSRLAEALARSARLQAEDAGLPAPVPDLPALPFAPPDTAAQVAGQARVFETRRAQNLGRAAGLAETLSQLDRLIEGLDAVLAARREQLRYLDRELEAAQSLQARGLMRESQVLALQRSRAEMVGAIAETGAERARQDNAKRNARLEVEQADFAFREEVATDLRSVRGEIDELVLQIATLTGEIARADIRAPAAGVVHEMTVTTAGGVVPADGTVMQVIPLAEGVAFELMLDPHEVDRVFAGQKAQVLFTAFDQRATPRLAGHVTGISPTTVTLPASAGAERSFYRVALALDEGEIARLPAGTRILPGMPVEAFLETGAHSVMSYLLQPLRSQIVHGFREP